MDITVYRHAATKRRNRTPQSSSNRGAARQGTSGSHPLMTVTAPLMCAKVRARSTRCRTSDVASGAAAAASATRTPLDSCRTTALLRASLLWHGCEGSAQVSAGQGMGMSGSGQASLASRRPVDPHRSSFKVPMIKQC
jgi:hypothetical protein